MYGIGGRIDGTVCKGLDRDELLNLGPDPFNKGFILGQRMVTAGLTVASENYRFLCLEE